jgi:hypothetical protein
MPDSGRRNPAFAVGNARVRGAAGASVVAMNKTARTILVALLLAGTSIGAVACSKKESASGSSGSKINKANIDKAQDAIAPPLPVADAKAKIVAILGEPTATEGEDLYWAAVDGNDCYQLKLLVQKGEAKGAMGGQVNKMVEEKFNSCVQHAGAKK